MNDLVRFLFLIVSQSVFANSVFLSPSYFNENQFKEVVMVSFKEGSLLEKKLLVDKRLLFVENTSPPFGRAYLQKLTDRERDSFAALSHEDTGFCAGVIPANLTFNLLDLGNALSPKIATTVKLQAVTDSLALLKSDNLSSTIKTLEAFTTRYHSSTQPNQVSDYLLSRWQELAPTGSTVTQITHTTTTQKSVVLKIPGTTSDQSAIILGAHLDSINKNATSAPGADDDASGIGALTEIIRVIGSQNLKFQRPIEFHAYAAEEVGLLGSTDLAQKAQSSAQSIAGMLQLDMIGYPSSGNDSTIHLITTDTSPVVTRQLKDLVALYLENQWKAATLSAGTSDHKSWHRLGYHVGFAFEDPNSYNPHLHSSDDTISHVDINYALRFTKLALAYLFHGAGVEAGVTAGASSWQKQQDTKNLLKIGIGRTSSGLRLSIAIDSSSDSASGELCKVSAKADTGCQSLVTDASRSLERSGKKFFVTGSDVKLTTNDLWRANIYGTNGTLTATRTFQVNRK